MSKVCKVTKEGLVITSGKGTITGNNRSHSLRATRRKWNSNLQLRCVTINGKETHVRMTTRDYRQFKKKQNSK